jgi:hypothetical protein
VPDDHVPDPREEQVRRLLADARHTEPLPDDVAARLDAVLGELAADATDTPDRIAPGRAPAADQLAAARRRRNVRTWLVAAAAVVAVGIGIGQLDLGSGGADDSAAGGSAADSGASSARVPSVPGPAPGFPGDAVRLHADGFAREVRRVVADGAPAVLVLRPPHGDSRVVDLYLCGSARPTRSITLPAP